VLIDVNRKSLASTVSVILIHRRRNSSIRVFFWLFAAIGIRIMMFDDAKIKKVGVILG
jgi:hypothetical protein